MLDPNDLANRLRKHFSNLSISEFLANVQRYSPELLQERQLSVKAELPQMTQAILPATQSAPLALDAYLASALTGLNSDQRQLVVTLSDLISTVCRENGIEVYEPRKKTDPVHHPQVRDMDVFNIDRDRVMGSDLLIFLSQYPSFGAGEELDFAYNALVPIILITHSNVRVSRMVTGIPSLKIEITYSEPEDLRSELRDRLLEIRPVLEQRKLAFSEYNKNIVGEKIRLLRESLALTRQDVAASVPQLTVDALAHLEESPDRLSNPTLLHLRQIAAVLKTTVADLVEPDIDEILMARIPEWAVNRLSKTNTHGIDVKSRNRLLRRFLLRMIDSLEDE